jgi:quercetin dioxygenase-like cupin family protein
MRRILLFAAAVIVAAVASCARTEEAPADADDADAANPARKPPPGSNEVLRGSVAAAPGLEAIVADVVIPPNAAVPRHYHPGEEFLYIIEGSAIHVEEGKPDLVLNAGDAYLIPPRAVHAPRGGPEGARAIVFRIHVTGEEERVLVAGETP